MVTDDAVLWDAVSPASRGPYARFQIDIPQLDFKFTGTGDLTAALLLAWYSKLPTQFATVCERTIASLQAVCGRTMAMCDGSVRSKELRIVESKADLESPTVILRARAIGSDAPDAGSG